MTKIKKGDTITITDRRTGKDMSGAVTKVSDYSNGFIDSTIIYTDLGFTFTLHILRRSK